MVSAFYQRCRIGIATALSVETTSSACASVDGYYLRQGLIGHYGVRHQSNIFYTPWAS